MIKNIKLTNFRKFKKLNLKITKKIVVIHGDNGMGKSTILEAIYLLTNGTSPWATSDEYINNKQKDGEQFARVEIQNDEKIYSFSKKNDKRTFKIDERNTTPKKFFRDNASTIFNPEQIEILMISPSERRNFLDEIVSIIDYEYKDTLLQFKKILRQRNAYLKKLSKKFYDHGIIARNDPQLNFWTNEFVKNSTIIRKKRQYVTNKLSFDGFHIEYIKSNNKDLEIDIENSKKRDIATGITNIGPHRDDWKIINGKDIKKYGSRGEKRLAIGQLIYKVQDLIYEELGFFPILLLDDISSELDIKNTKFIFDNKFLKKQQTFITIINYREIPKAILKDAQVIDLNTL
jgi:DNA replication and repair protein RecF